MDNTSDGHHHHFSGTHYVISEDIDVLVSRQCRKAGLIQPHMDFYVDIRAKMKDFLQNIFARVTFVASQEIREGLLESVKEHRRAGLTVVSLERAYLEDDEIDARIELTRTVDGDAHEIVVPSVRRGTREKKSQFEGLRGKNIALIDDVVFSGKTIVSTISGLHHYHSNVHAVTTAIGVKNGVDYLRKAYFGIIGMPPNLTINCLEEFDHISDQVCERDFYPGVPYSGREHFGHQIASFPYVFPLGKMREWASIPEKEIRSFSALCIDNTIALFREVEKLNGITFSCSSVPRPIFRSPRDSTPFISFLNEKRAECLGR